MSSTKTAIVVLSNPQGREEALGRLFNALAATYDFKQKHQRRPTGLPEGRDAMDGTADHDRSPRARALQGQRRQRSPVLPLEWRQADLKTGEVRLHKGTTKRVTAA
jgi:hypothetical protein